MKVEERRRVLRGMLALGGALALDGCTAMSPAGSAITGLSTSQRLSGGNVSVRWLGGGIAELATPDYKQIAYADAWFWSNAGWTRFNVQKPAEYSTSESPI